MSSKINTNLSVNNNISSLLGNGSEMNISFENTLLSIQNLYNYIQLANEEKLDKNTVEFVNKLKLSINWYEHSMVNDNLSFTLISLFIGLETLIFFGDFKENNKKSIISNSCSILLGTTVKEKYEIRDKLIKLYNERNKVMHDGHHITINLYQDITWLKDILQRTIRKNFSLLKK